MLKDGGGMPFKNRSRIDVQRRSITDEFIEVRFIFHYRLTLTYRLVALIDRRMARANLDASLPRLFEAPPERH